MPFIRKKIAINIRTDERSKSKLNALNILVIKKRGLFGSILTGPSRTFRSGINNDIPKPSKRPTERLNSIDKIRLTPKER